MIINGIEYKIASSSYEIKSAYALVYENYVEKHFCRSDHYKMRIYLFDSLLSTRTFVAKDGDLVVATVTLVFDSAIGLPSDSLYKDRLESLRASGKRICEISKLATRKDLGAKAIRILPYLFRSCWLYAKDINPHTHFCITVEPKNQGFYQKSYFFENNSEIRLDHKAGETPSVFLEMLIDQPRDSFDLKNAKSRSLYEMHFSDPDIKYILSELNTSESNISRMNHEIQTRSSKEISDKSHETYLDLKLFIIKYNLGKLSRYAHSQSARGMLHDAAVSYEKLLQTIPDWTFRTEKYHLYVELGAIFLSIGSYAKLADVGISMQHNSEIISYIHGINLQAIGSYLLGDRESAFILLAKSERISRLNGCVKLFHCLYSKAMILNYQGDHESALSVIKEANESNEPGMNFLDKTSGYRLSFSICHHLGMVASCKRICDQFSIDITSTTVDREHHQRVMASFYTCLYRFNILTMRNKEGVVHFESLLRMLSRNESPWEYSVHLANYSICLMSIGETKLANDKISQALDLRDFYPKETYIRYLAKKIHLCTLLSKKDEVDWCKSALKVEIDASSQDPVSRRSLWEAALFENRIEMDFSSIQDSLSSIDIKYIPSKPPLTGEIDMATISILLGDYAGARRFLLSDMNKQEIEILGSDIDNSDVINVYLDILNERFDLVCANTIKILSARIRPDEVLSKLRVLFNVTQMLRQINSANPSKECIFALSKLLRFFYETMSGHAFPAFSSAFERMTQEIPRTGDENE